MTTKSNCNLRYVYSVKVVIGSLPARVTFFRFSGRGYSQTTYQTENLKKLSDLYDLLVAQFEDDGDFEDHVNDFINGWQVTM